MGLRRELAYPSQRNRLDRDAGMGEGSLLRKGLTRARTKNGNQHIVNALMMMPRVVDALRSLARANLNFLLWCDRVTQGADVGLLWFLVLGFLRMNFPMLLFLEAPPGLAPCWWRIGHWDSLERRGAVDAEKQRVLPLHWNRKQREI
jgi:hypothetical protein